MTDDPEVWFIDAHHHFQDIEAYDYLWLDPSRAPALEGDLSPIRRNFLPDEYRQLVSGWRVRKSVHIQNGWRAEDPIGETRWLSGLIQSYDLDMAIIGYADLANSNIEHTLDAHLAFEHFRGIRQILNWHENPALQVASRPDLMEQPQWRRGFAALAERNLSFDLQIYWPQMEMALELAQDFPRTQIVLNHFGMPIDRSASALRHWTSAIERLALADNVSVKLSGYGLGHPHWSKTDTIPLLQAVTRIFGPERTMFGSNLPVDLLFSTARKIFETFDASLLFLANDDRDRIRHSNAERIYRF